MQRIGALARSRNVFKAPVPSCLPAHHQPKPVGTPVHGRAIREGVVLMGISVLSGDVSRSTGICISVMKC